MCFVSFFICYIVNKTYHFGNEIDRSRNIIDYKNITTNKNDEFEDIIVTLIINATDQVPKLLKFLGIPDVTLYKSRNFEYRCVTKTYNDVSFINF